LLDTAPGYLPYCSSVRWCPLRACPAARKGADEKVDIGSVSVVKLSSACLERHAASPHRPNGSVARGGKKVDNRTV